MYLFRSFRKPKLEHHYKIIDETIELRKLMGWTGHGGITNGMLNPSGMVSHYRRFDNLSDKDSAIKLGAIINIDFFEINSKTRFLISYTKLTNNYCKHQP